MKKVYNIHDQLVVIEKKIRRAEDRVCVLKGEYIGLRKVRDLEQEIRASIKKEQQQIDNL